MDLFKKFKDKREAKKKQKKASRGQFEKIVVGGRTLPVLNFYLFSAKDQGKRFVELASVEELPELHYSEVEMEIFLTTKKLAVKGRFENAYPKGRFKVYKFEVLDMREFYI